MLQGGMWVHLWQRLSERYHDWRLGVATRGFRSAAEYSSSKDCQSYEPLEYASIARALREVPFDQPQALLDYGAGMGRVLALASRLPFQRVIGVELSPELCAIARANIGRLQLPSGMSIEVIEADAADFEVPRDVTVCFLYNPFVGAVLERVVKQIEASLRTAPRRLIVLHVRFMHDPNPFIHSPCVRHSRRLSVVYRPTMELVVSELGSPV